MAIHPKFQSTINTLQLSATEPSFSTVINELRQKCSRLSAEIHQLRSRENEELERRRLAEEEISRLQSIQGQLETKVQSYSEAVKYYKAIASRCYSGLEKIMPILDDVRNNILAEKPRDVL